MKYLTIDMVQETRIALEVAEQTHYAHRGNTNGPDAAQLEKDATAAQAAYEAAIAAQPAPPTELTEQEKEEIAASTKLQMLREIEQAKASAEFSATASLAAAEAATSNEDSIRHITEAEQSKEAVSQADAAIQSLTEQ